MTGHLGPISGIASWGERYIATAGYDNQVILWDAATSRPESRVLHDHLANQCAFSPDGRWLVTASSDYSGRVWALPDLRLHAVLGDHQDDVEMAAFHPDRELIATASRDHQVRVFDFAGQLVQRFRGHTADVLSVEWSADGWELISSSDDGTIKRWSLESGAMVSDIDMNGVETDTIALSADGRIFAGNDEGDIVTIAADGASARTDAHEAGVKRLVLAADQRMLISLSYDRQAKLWDTTGPSPELMASTTMPDDVWPRSCAFAADGTIVFGTFGSTYRTFDYRSGTWDDKDVPPTLGLNAATATGEPGRALTVGDAGIVFGDDAGPGAAAGRREVARTGSLCNFLTPAGRVVLTGGQLGKLFDARTGRTLHQHRSPLNCGTAFVRAGRTVAAIGTYTGEGLLFGVDGDAVTFERTLPLLANAVKGIAAGPSTLFAVCADCSATWWDLDTLTQIRFEKQAHERIVNGCVSLGGDDFASVGRDRILRIWDSTGHVEAIATPHEHSIKCVTARADGSVIATGGYDGMIGIFDRVAGQWRDVRRLTHSGVSSLSYDAAGDEFLASSYDGTLYRIPAWT